MNAILWGLGQNSIAAALMIPFVLLACRPFRNRPAVRHVLWTVVLLKMVTPPIVSWPWTLEQFRDSIWSSADSQPSVRMGAESTPHDAVLPRAAEIERAELARLPREFPDGCTQSKGADVERSDTSAAAVAADDGPDWIAIACWIAATVWLGGAACCLFWQFRRIGRHASVVRRGATAPAHLTAEIAGMANRLGMSPPRTVLARGILAPFMWCLGRLRLVWPEAMSSAADVARSRGVIAHELAHVRRGDHWLAWLEMAAGIVWWWNPLFWFVRRRLREAAEMACDALAIGTNPESRREYAELLLELSAGCKSGAPAPVLAVSAGTPSSFERRLSMILSESVSGKLSSWGILTAVCLALAALPGWSLGQQKEPLRASSPADDPVLRDLIEQGKFAEAKERLETLRKKHAADRNVADGVFPEKWNAILAKELPASCLKGIPRNAGLSWKLCMSCHGGQKEEAKPEQPLHFYPRETEWKLRFTNEIPLAKIEAGPEGQRWPIERAAGRPFIGFNGNKRAYIVVFDEKGATLEALNADHKRLWQMRFADSLPNRKSEDKWILEEPKDVKEVVLSWISEESRTVFCFDSNSGKVLRQGSAPNPEPGLGKKPTGGIDGPSLSKQLEQANAGVEAAKTRIERLRARKVPIGETEMRAALFAMENADSHKRVVIGRIKDACNAADARLTEAQAELKRVQQLVQEGTVSKTELDAARVRRDAAQEQARLLAALLGLNTQTPSGPSLREQEATKAAEAQRALANAEYQRAMKLYNDKAISRAEFDAIKARFLAADALLKRHAEDALLKRHAEDALRRKEAPDGPRANWVEKPKQGIFIPARPGQYIETAPPGKVPPAAPPALSSQWAILDLAERYLNAAADVKKARSRIARLKKDTRAAAQKDLDEAEIELERADYHQKLLAKFMRDALDSARADAAAAETAHARAAELYKQRLIGQPQVEAAKARADDALRLMKQLESVLSDMGLMPTGSAPKKGPQEITPELAELAARYVADKKSDAETIDALYKAVLGRAPTDAERAFGIKSLASAAKDRQAALLDIVYALISSKDARPSKPR